MTEIIGQSATELARGIRRGEHTPTAVVQAHLDRIEAVDDDVNAFVTLNDDALAEAREATAAVESGASLGPLHGVPVAVKDLSDTAGLRTTVGSKLLADTVPETDAIFVRRLKAAGAIVLGKTNTPEFGRLSTVTRNELFETTRNPWDTAKTTGGSSGGSAAAVAAGMVPIAQGSDAAGSIRIPSAACGTYGLMPDFGRVPSGPDRPDAFANTHPFSFLGPITRSVEDAALMLDVMSGPDARDPFALPARERSYRETLGAPVGDLRVAYSPDLGICPLVEEVRDAVDGAVDALRGSVATVDRVDPDLPEWGDAHDPLATLLQDRYRGLYDSLKEEGIDILDRREEVTDEVVSRVEKSLELSAGDVRRAERRRTVVYDAVQDLLTDYDLLCSATLSVPAFDVDSPPTEIDGEPVHPIHGFTLTWPFNLTGNPTASVPAGTVDGLPVGLQVTGRRGADDTVLAASAALERLDPWDGAYPVDP
jgi:Asp-tRNA(Asn)/Glu-tRNA(Gln) amidotransferase A subunit family amidase